MDRAMMIIMWGKGPGQDYCGVGSTYNKELNVESNVLPVKKEGDTKKIRIAFLGDSITEG